MNEGARQANEESARLGARNQQDQVLAKLDRMIELLERQLEYARSTYAASQRGAVMRHPKEMGR
jgi:hypothetical protein